MNTHLISIAATVVLTVALACAGQNAPLTDADIKPIPCEMFTLGNGIRVIVSEQHATPTVALHVYVTTGLIHEDEYLGCGISHYIEHMAAEPLNPLGTTANAYTTIDHTCYHCAVLKERWEEAAGLLAACVTQTNFTPELVAREKGVISQEIRMDEEVPDRALGRLLDETAFLRTSLRVPLIGWMNCFTNLTRADAMTFYRRRYVANNIIVSIAGDVQTEEVRAVVEKLFGGIPRGPEQPLVMQAEPRPVARRSAMQRFNVNTARGALSFPGVTLDHADLCALDLLAGVLGDGDMSILVKHLKDDQQLVYSISSGNWSPYFCPGTFNIQFECDESNATRAVEQVLRELEAVKSTTVEPERLERVRRMLLTQRLKGLQDPDRIAASLGDGLLISGDPQFDANYLRRMLRVTAPDLQRVARTYLDTNAMTVAMLLPEAAAATGSTVAAAQSFDASFAVTQLANGVLLVLRPDHRLPLAAFSVCFSGGLASESPTNNGISSLTAALMTKGSSRYNADQIATMLESLGASLDVSAARDGMRASASCLAGDAGAVVELLAECLLRPAFSDGEVEKERRLALANIRTLRDEWFQEGLLFFNRSFFQGHAFAMPLAGDSNVVAKLSRNDLVAFHQRMMQPSNIVIAVAGDFDSSIMLPLLARWFDRARAVAPPLEVCAMHRVPSSNSTTIIASTREQATVMVGYGGAAALADDRYAAIVAEAVPRGFEGALFKALRGTTNLVYIASAMPVMEPQAGAMICLAQCVPENVPCVLQIMTNVVAQLAAEAISTTRLARVKADLLTQHYEQRQALQDMAAVAALWEYRGRGANMFLQFPDRIKAVTAAEAQTAARRYFGAWTSVVIMPSKE